MSEDARARLMVAIDEVLSAFSGEAGIAAKNLKTGEQILLNENKVYATASSAKTFVITETFRQVEAERITLDQRVPMRKEDRVLGSGVLRELQPGLEPTVLDLATLMIIVSDNTATNMLIDLLGIDNIRRTMSDLGLLNSHLNHRIDLDAVIADPRHFAEASPADFVRLIELISKHEILTPASCEHIVAIMSKQQVLNAAPRFLPYMPYADELHIEPDIIVANKPGDVNGVRTDVLLVRHPAVEYAAAIMTDGCTDEAWNEDYEGLVTIAHLSRLIYDYFTGQATQ
jgi:beta-lactamase class A